MIKYTFEIDYAMADKITIRNLSEYRDSLKETLNNHLENGAWMHPDDVPHSKEMIKAINFVLKDFGVESGEDTVTD